MSAENQKEGKFPGPVSVSLHGLEDGAIDDPTVLNEPTDAIRGIDDLLATASYEAAVLAPKAARRFEARLQRLERSRTCFWESAGNLEAHLPNMHQSLVEDNVFRLQLASFP